MKDAQQWDHQILQAQNDILRDAGQLPICANNTAIVRAIQIDALREAREIVETSKSYAALEKLRRKIQQLELQ